MNDFSNFNSHRLFKKAMKQRRGSVENVAETLMVALAASGESQESIAKVNTVSLGNDGRVLTFKKLPQMISKDI